MRRRAEMPPTSERRCIHCQSDIRHKKSHAKYCNRKCKSAWLGRNLTADKREKRRQLAVTWRSQHPGYKSPKYLIDHPEWRRSLACRNCGVSFEKHVPNQVHCTNTCKRRLAERRYRPRASLRAKLRYRKSVYGSEHIEIENMNKDRFRKARQLGYRSGLEVAIAKELESLGAPFEYESEVITYTQPQKERSYHPDFKLPNGIFIETKGVFQTQDRQKHLLIKRQYPQMDLRFIFSNSNARISKQSQTRYRDWCEKNGFKYADKHLPREWLEEKLNG